MRESPDFTLLIPLHNEEGCLRESVETLLAFVERLGLAVEVLLGSNGSTDGTVEVGARLESEHVGRVRFFHLRKKGVVGDVFRRAVGMASSPRLISMDVDLSVNLEFIPRALSLLDSHAVVVGSKKSGSQNRSVVRRFGSEAYIFCAQALLGLPYDDYSIGAKGYDLRRVAPYVADVSDDTNYVLDLLYACHRAGLPIAILPVSCDDWRTSRFNLTKEALVRYSHLFGMCLGALWRREDRRCG